ncbi:hypothetical protein BDQ12DRAFT_730057 [Crucibulum laeve]|uniref:Uncharacterized protein n=1 Tax=Crucibulum laeve TaxID=68775 RepID=A0A5C3LFN7_9AGAR|nr:hypothetical protein BDQ12DRAFT_730057 [Crucibulum laeve]
MFLTRVIPIGTLTVILRINVQFLVHIGLFILGRLVVASTPQTASLETHDVVNRYIGQSTTTKVTAKWIFSRVVRTPPVESSNGPLLLVLCLSLSYNVFVSLSDTAFSGLYPCTVESTAVDTPASIRTADDTRTFIASQLINGTDIY